MNQIDTTPYQEFAKEKLGFSFNDINLGETIFPPINISIS